MPLYRWTKSYVAYSESKVSHEGGRCEVTGTVAYRLNKKPSIAGDHYDLTTVTKLAVEFGSISGSGYYAFDEDPKSVYNVPGSPIIGNQGGNKYSIWAGNSVYTIKEYKIVAIQGTDVGYVYSIEQDAYPTDGESGGYWYSSRIEVAPPTLTTPELAMQGQAIPISWTAVDGATAYTIQRKADSGNWTQVYSGSALSCNDVAGNWSMVQYRIQATVSAATTDWGTSASVPVVSASALVISGQDGDLGTLVDDVPYTISTETGNQISVKTTVNGAVIFDGTVESGTAKAIPVLNLVTGTGIIVIEASVQISGSTVSAVRSWIYTKAAMTFLRTGSPAQLAMGGKDIWPKTLAECVRLPGGRTLDEVTGFSAQIHITRYTGTGTYGSGDPNEVTVPFKPLAVFVTSESDGTTVLMVMPGTQAMIGSAAISVVWDDTGVSWYSNNAANQLNASGATYDVVVFG